MGCCHSAARYVDNCDGQKLIKSQDACYPDIIGHGGLKVFTSSTGSDGRVFTRLVVSPDYVFAALFESHSIGSGNDHAASHCSSNRSAAAQFCAKHCYNIFVLNWEKTRSAPSTGVQGALTETLKRLDLAFLEDVDVQPQDRLTSGCTAVLLHLTLGPERVATAASVGPCAAIIGQRLGGLASATSAPLLLTGGLATSHDALQAFLVTQAAAHQQQGGTALRSSKSNLRQLKDHAANSTPAALLDLTTLQYNKQPDAPQALGFACAKGVGMVRHGSRPQGAPGGPSSTAVVGLNVQTSRQILGPADECVVLLSDGAAAAITPADVALLMHRMGQLSGIPFEAKPQALPSGASKGVVKLDNMGIVGPQLPSPPGARAAAGVPPFNAARLLVQHAKSNIQRPSSTSTDDGSACAMAMVLEWPQSAGADTAVAEAAVGAAVSVIRAAAATAARERRRAQYHWQLLRMYYKFPYKRRVAIIKRWHELFDRITGEARREARSKEVTAWKRMGAALQVSTAGYVRSVLPKTSRENLRPPVSAGGAPHHSPGPTPVSARTRSSPISVGEAQQTFGSPSAIRQRATTVSNARATLYGSPAPAVTPVAATGTASTASTSVRQRPSAAASANSLPAPRGTSGGLDVQPTRTAAEPSHPASTQNRADLVCAQQLSAVGTPTGIATTSGIPTGRSSGRSVRLLDAECSSSVPVTSTTHPKAEAQELEPQSEKDRVTGTRVEQKMLTPAASEPQRIVAQPILHRSPSNISQLSAGGAVSQMAQLCSGGGCADIGMARIGGGASAGATPRSGIPALISGLPRQSSVTPRSQISVASPASLGAVGAGTIPARIQAPTGASTTPAQLQANQRVSVPGVLTPGFATPASTIFVTPPSRNSTTCGGAIGSSPRNGGARSSGGGAGSRLPLPPSAGPASPSGDVVKRSLFIGRGGVGTSGGGSAVSGVSCTGVSASVSGAGDGVESATKSRLASIRPPQLNMQVDAGMLLASETGAKLGMTLGSGAASGCLDGELDLLSPDAAQLAAWAMEAVVAITSPRQAESQQVQPVQTAQEEQIIRQQPAVVEGRTINDEDDVKNSFSGSCSLIACNGSYGAGSMRRLPLSRRDDNNPLPAPPRSASTTGQGLPSPPVTKPSLGPASAKSFVSPNSVRGIPSPASARTLVGTYGQVSGDSEAHSPRRASSVRARR